MHLRAWLAAIFLAVLALVVPATASAGAGASGDGDDALVVLVGDANVPAGKTVEGVYVAAGSRATSSSPAATCSSPARSRAT